MLICQHPFSYKLDLSCLQQVVGQSILFKEELSWSFKDAIQEFRDIVINIIIVDANKKRFATFSLLRSLGIPP
jgi:hypothetical protein